MFVRATTIDAQPALIDDGIAYVKEAVVPALADLSGSLGLSMFVDRRTGMTTVTTAWETEQDRDASDAALAPLRQGGVRALGADTAVVELLELAVLDRRRPAEVGFWSRLTRVSVDPSYVENAVDAYTASTMHDLQLLDGYCSAVLLVDRKNGMGAVSVVFDSLAALEASRGPAEALRTSGLAKAGAEMIDVRESQIAIAGIRMPQSG